MKVSKVRRPQEEVLAKIHAVKAKRNHCGDRARFG